MLLQNGFEIRHFLVKQRYGNSEEDPSDRIVVQEIKLSCSELLYLFIRVCFTVVDLHKQSNNNKVDNEHCDGE